MVKGRGKITISSGLCFKTSNRNSNSIIVFSIFKLLLLQNCIVEPYTEVHTHINETLLS